MVSITSETLAIPEDVVYGTTGSYTVPAGKYAVAYMTNRSYIQMQNSVVPSYSHSNLALRTRHEVTSHTSEVTLLEGQTVSVATTGPVPPGNFIPGLGPKETVYTRETYAEIDGINEVKLLTTNMIIITNNVSANPNWGDAYLTTTDEPYWTIAVYPKPINNLPDELKE